MKGLQVFLKKKILL